MWGVVFVVVLIALAIKYWYITIPLVVIGGIAFFMASSRAAERQLQEQERERREYEQWLNGPPPPFLAPGRFTQNWIEANVPYLHPGQVAPLLKNMRSRGWSDTAIEQRVSAYLPDGVAQASTVSGSIAAGLSESTGPAALSTKQNAPDPNALSPDEASPTSHGIKQTELGQEIALRAAGGQSVSVLADDLVDPVGFVEQYDSPGDNKRYVATRVTIVHRGGGALSCAPQDETRFIGSDGAEYEPDFYPELVVPTFGGSDIHLAPGDSRMGYVYAPMPDGVEPASLQLSIGYEFKGAEIGRWQIDPSQGRSAIQASAQGAVQPVVESEMSEPDMLAVWTTKIDSGNLKDRQVALSGLKKMPQRSRGILLAHVSDPDLSCRTYAVEGLAELRDPALLPVFRGVLQDPVDVMRRLAVRALKVLGTHEAVQAIRVTANDPSPLVQREVQLALTINRPSSE